MIIDTLDIDNKLYYQQYFLVRAEIFAPFISLPCVSKARKDLTATLGADVRRVLLRRGVREDDFEPFLARLIQQAEALYANWPSAA